MSSPRAPRLLRGDANFSTTDALALRLDTLRRYYRRSGAFGLDVLDAAAADGRRVLEVGPGNGMHALTYLRRTLAEPVSWTLVDLSEAMAAAARAALEGEARVRAVVGDAGRLPLAAEARFDLVVAMHVLGFVASPRGVLRSLAARLARGGRLLVTTSEDDMLALRRPVRDALRERGLPWRHVTADYAASRAERDLRALFRRVERHAQAGALEFPDAEPAVRYALSMPWFGEGRAGAAARKDAAARIRRAATRAIAETGLFRVAKGAATFVASEPRRAAGA